MNPRTTLSKLAGLLGVNLADRHYPAKPIQLVVGYAAGGPADAFSRMMAKLLAARLGVAVTVRNQPSADGAGGAQYVASSVADGYTLLLGTSSELVGTGLLNRAQWYDPLKDFTPIAQLASGPLVLVVGPQAPMRTLDAFIDRMKHGPGPQCSYGSPGRGSIQYFMAELIRQRAGPHLTHVPFRDMPVLVKSLTSGALDFAGLAPQLAMPLIQRGQVVPLAVTSPARVADLPAIPALDEHPLFKDCSLMGWYGLLGPRRLPSAIVRRLQAAVQLSLRDAAGDPRIAAYRSFLATGHEDLRWRMRDDTAKYTELIRLMRLQGTQRLAP
jgi:tripartite-type tricarboxylate transporter receptor subunit TctC